MRDAEGRAELRSERLRLLSLSPFMVSITLSPNRNRCRAAARDGVDRERTSPRDPRARIYYWRLLPNGAFNREGSGGNRYEGKRSGCGGAVRRCRRR